MPVDCGVRKIRVLPAVCSTKGYRVGEWTGPTGSSDSCLLGWCILAVEGEQSLKERVEEEEDCTGLEN